MFLRRKKRSGVRHARASAAFATALALGSVGAVSAYDYPVTVTSYAVVPQTVIVPTTYTVLRPTAMTYVTPTQLLPTVFMPTVSWSPLITYAETVELLPLEMPCLQTFTTVVESPAILSTPQVSAVEELPVESESVAVPAESPAKAADEAEPELRPETQSPPISPEAGASSKLPSAETKPEAKAPAEAKPEASKPGLPEDDDVPMNLPPAKEWSSTPPPAAETPKAAPAENPPVPPAEKKDEPKSSPLKAPEQPGIPLPDATVPELSPVPTSAPAVPPPASNAEKLPDLPPPASAEELPAIPEKKAESASPGLIPVPEIPIPEESSPVPAAKEGQEGLKDTSLKPLDTEAIKAGAAKTQEATMKRRESQRPVIESTPLGQSVAADLEVLVRSARLGSADDGVKVRFQETTTKASFDTVSDSGGRSRVRVPEGRWEVLVESTGGTLYVLGDVVSKDGRVTTATGRELPVLEINR